MMAMRFQISKVVRVEVRMSQQIQILSAAGVLLKLVPLAYGSNVVMRLRNLGMRPFYKVRGKQLLIVFAPQDRDTALKVLPQCVTDPSPGDKCVPLNGWIVGRIT
jgi:hypothetical protein